jgi:hypothetical protein
MDNGAQLPDAGHSVPLDPGNNAIRALLHSSLSEAAVSLYGNY